MSDLLADMNKQILAEFSGEIADLIDAIEPDVALAKALDKQLASRVFRCFTTLKEVSASFGFSFIATLSTSAENYLSFILGNKDEIRRSGKNDKMVLETFLKTFDLIKEIVKIIALQRPDDGFAPQVDDIKSRFHHAMEELHAQQKAAAARGEEIRVELTSDLIDAFKAESVETMANVEQLLLVLCENSENGEALGEAFRGIHSFKGNCGIFGLIDAQHLSHVMESCLGRIRDGRPVDKQGIFAASLGAVDLLKQALSLWNGTDPAPIAEAPAQIAVMEKFLHEATGDPNNQTIADTLATQEPSSDQQSRKKSQKISDSEERQDMTASDEHREIAKLATDLDTSKVKKHADSTKPSAREEIPQHPEPQHPELQQPELQQPTSPKPTASRSLGAPSQDIRVTIQKLDMINNLAGELVTAKTMLLTNLAALYLEKNEALEKSIGFLEKTINDLRDVAVEIRMTPVQGVFKKMVRIIHDLSLREGKKINVEFCGEETEVDKTIIERIADPIAHMVRNAIDHGLETSGERRAAGKSEEGLLRLSARHEGGMVWIVVEDDGKGLDRDKILKKAQAQGLIANDGRLMTDQDVYKLIFQAGFSTADEVTDISGRGVGMDVVLQNVRDLRGVIEIDSRKGQGTRFILKLPLTLAIMDGMLFEVRGVKYIIPVDEIREIVPMDKKSEIHIEGSHWCIMVRGELIPIVTLDEIYRLAEESPPSTGTVLLVIECDSRRVALGVDKIIGQHQTVVKPLSRYFEGLKGIKSCSILGNGEVSLILESAQLLAAAA